MTGPADIYRDSTIQIWMIRIVGVGTAALHHGREIYEFPLEKKLQTVMNLNRRDAQKPESLRRHCPKPEVVKSAHLQVRAVPAEWTRASAVQFSIRAV